MKFETLEAGLKWLESQHNNESKRHNEKIKVAMEFFNNPHETFPIIHVTGTNGKGSVTSYLRDLLMSQGLTVGTFTSPHIERINERIAVNGQPISDKDLLAIIEKMYDVNEYLATTEYGRLVFFENYTVMMALYFQQVQPDIVVVEVGIGGLHDSTNIMDGEVAVITTVGIDHADRLGNTFEEVAYQKAGIIKPGAIAVVGDVPAEALRVIKQISNEQGAQLRVYHEDFDAIDIHVKPGEGTEYTYQFQGQTRGDWKISMLGAYQVDNSAVALTAFYEWMQLRQRVIDWDAARQALSQTHWIGRMERVHQAPLIYIDGAHNVQGLEAVKQLIEENFSDKHIQVLYAGLERKNQEAQLEILRQFSSQEVDLTTFDHFEAMSLEQFDALIESHHLPREQFHLVGDWQQLIQQFVAENKKDSMLLITGSLYFISAVRKFILETLN